MRSSLEAISEACRIVGTSRFVKESRHLITNSESMDNGH
jgi:hypothetical protein